MNNQDNIEALQYEVNILLEALLLNAGAKRAKLDELIELYIEHIDDFSLNTQKEGADELLEFIAHLKLHYKEFFQ